VEGALSAGQWLAAVGVITAMDGMKNALSDRRALWACVAGCLAVTAGVDAHLPMFAMARGMHYHLAGMPMTGLGVAAYGLLPRA
jgi:putative MFS transporter